MKLLTFLVGALLFFNLTSCQKTENTSNQETTTETSSEESTTETAETAPNYSEEEKKLFASLVDVQFLLTQEGENAVEGSSAKALFSKKEEHYLFEGAKLCSGGEDGWFGLDCTPGEPPAQCISLDWNNGELTIYYTPWCASVNDDRTQVYKQAN